MYHPERRWRSFVPSWLRTWTMLFALVTLLCASTASADSLVQTYCSSENTGSDMTPQQSIYQSNGRCTGNCTDLYGVAYAFAIVQGDNCWCSDYIPADQTSVGNCDATCVGYPYEYCGNQGANLFGYIQIGTPAGTAGASSASSTQAPDSSSDETSSSAQAQTVFNSVTVTNDLTTTISPSVSVIVSTFTATPSTTSTSSTSTPTTTSTPIAVPLPVTSSSSETPTTTSSPSPVTSVQILTISGAPVTQTVTSMPTTLTASDPGQQQPIQQSSSKVSAGLIAGVVVAAVIASLAIAGLLFFCWRRKKQRELEAAAAATMVESGAPSSRPTRNTSVLSKTGLLERVYPSAAMAQRSHANSNAATHEASGGVSPISERRRSQPLFYDQRLNPTTLLNYDNGSRISVNTLPDNRDFSRTLNVTNPDPHDSWQ